MWTLDKLKGLIAAGKIRGYKASALAEKCNEKSPRGILLGKHFKKNSKEKDWIAWNLWAFAQENGIKLFEEFRFDETGNKRFRFDWCFPERKWAFEYEGIFSAKSGHTTPTGYTKDTIKYNLAQQQGWTVIRLTAINYKTLGDELRN